MFLSIWAACCRRSTLEMLTFIGEASVALMKLLVGKAQFRCADLYLTMQECGAQALPIVSLISILVGLILAFIGAVQLKIFGAQIYVASLVGIGMAAGDPRKLLAESKDPKVINFLTHGEGQSEKAARWKTMDRGEKR